MKQKKWIYLLIGLIAIIVIIYFVNTSNKSDRQEQVYTEEDISMYIHKDFSINEESKNKYRFKNLIAPNGQAFLLKYNNKPLTLKKGDVVSLNLELDLPDDITNQFVLGYYLNDSFYHVFSDQISNKLDTSFNISKDGEYMICIVGSSASYLSITDGLITIKK